jgi:hypothetical protein
VVGHNSADLRAFLGSGGVTATICVAILVVAYGVVIIATARRTRAREVPEGQVPWDLHPPTDTDQAQLGGALGVQGSDGVLQWGQMLASRRIRSLHAGHSR